MFCSHASWLGRRENCWSKAVFYIFKDITIFDGGYAFIFPGYGRNLVASRETCCM